jgi:hypothetical protein
MIFKKSVEDRLSSWLELRKQVDRVINSTELVAEFWSHAPFTPYNKNINQYDPKSWPTPWQILVDNVYDDFTVALMIAFSLKYTEKYRNVPVKIDTLVNNNKNQIYNLVIVNNDAVLNYQPSTVITTDTISSDLYLDNSVLVTRQ